MLITLMAKQEFLLVLINPEIKVADGEPRVYGMSSAH